MVSRIFVADDSIGQDHINDCNNFDDRDQICLQ